MEIKGFSSIVNSYKANAYEKSDKTVKPAVSSRKTDVVEFSSVKAETIGDIKSKIADSVRASASEQRINDIRQAVKNGEYNITAETIVRAIIG